MRIFMDRFRKRFSGFSSIWIILAVIILLLMTGDKGTTAALCWLAVVFAISFFMRPYVPQKGIRYPHGAFAISYGLGLFLCFYTSWTISSFGICDYSDPVIHVCFVILAVTAYVIRRYILKEAYISRGELSGMLNGFAVFAVIFLAFFWMIGFNPLVDPGTENFMDFGFLQTIYRQKSALPYDPWFSGTRLDHYYYLGQAMVICMCRLAHTTPEYGYNMMLATFSGMVFSMVYELCGGIFCALAGDDPNKKPASLFGSIMGGTVAAFGGNPHWLIFGVLRPAFYALTGRGKVGYWFPDGTVYIKTDHGDPDNGKSEFPAYSTILGDLHAHVIDVIFVLPLLAVLFSFVMSYRDEDEKKNRKYLIYSLVLISALLGYYKGANYWDFAIYYVITGAVIVFSDIKRGSMKLRTFAGIGTKAVIVTALSYVLILPFTINFAKMESGIGICDTHTPLIKLIVLWAIPVLFACLLIYFMYRRTCTGLDKTCRASVLAMTLCAIGLVISPEVIYIKDIYGEESARFNTMFKLTYQAVVLFAIVFGILSALILCRVLSEKSGRIKYGMVLACLTVYAVLSAAYTGHAAKQWFGDPFEPASRWGISTLDGLQYDNVYGFEMEAAGVLMEDDARVVNIVEAAGNVYVHESALSVYSGACTPLGWYVHEWMWHNDPEPVRARAEQVAYFYSGNDENYCRDFLKAYDIDYIFVGPAEVCKYPVYSDVFKKFGRICVSTVWQDRELFLLKVDRSLL